MKILKIMMLSLAVFFMTTAIAQDELPPFYGVNVDQSIEELKPDISLAITNAGYEIVGEYKVAGKSNLYVLAFSSEELKKLCGEFEDRGALASVFKLGLTEKDGKTEISILNPNYMFYAYFGDDYKLHANELNAIDQQVKQMVSTKYGELSGFGGGLEAEKLMKYHYKVMMPYFDDPVELETFSSFKEGLSFIRKKIAASGDDLKLIYEVVNESKQTAVFGIGLLDSEKGEPHFLPIIGERHIAAMPYEIILQFDEVSMLAGKYRFALYWPELTMGEFMKIMSTPGDVEEFMESVTQKE